jgi:long-subunit acyl-CoA synthetase (AMP-forming)
MTETGVCTMRRTDEPEGAPPTDGVPLPGVELRAERNPRSDPAGELLVRTPGMFAGYLARGTIRPAPEWFGIGDLGEDDGRGAFASPAASRI